MYFINFPINFLTPKFHSFQSVCIFSDYFFKVNGVFQWMKIAPFVFGPEKLMVFDITIIQYGVGNIINFTFVCPWKWKFKTCQRKNNPAHLKGGVFKESYIKVLK